MPNAQNDNNNTYTISELISTIIGIALILFFLYLVGSIPTPPCVKGRQRNLQLATNNQSKQIIYTTPEELIEVKRTETQHRRITLDNKWKQEILLIIESSIGTSDTWAKPYNLTQDDIQSIKRITKKLNLKYTIHDCNNDNHKDLTSIGILTYKKDISIYESILVYNGINDNTDYKHALEINWTK